MSLRTLKHKVVNKNIFFTVTQQPSINVNEDRWAGNAAHMEEMRQAQRMLENWKEQDYLGQRDGDG
jgi:hypothetical protein